MNPGTPSRPRRDLISKLNPMTYEDEALRGLLTGSGTTSRSQLC